MSTEPPLVDTVRSFADRHGLLEEATRIVVGVSGGADSMVCLDVLRRLGADVVAAHVNYGLRESADDDEALVRDWCAAQTPPIPLRRRTADPSTDDGRSLQAVARRQRYRFFTAIARETGAEAVAVGHHRDDQAETLLLNLIRGSGPEGLTGMPPSRPLQADASIRLIRPLLSCRRDDIEDYASAAGIPWCVDETNRDAAYRRGRIRTRVLPALEACQEGATENIARAADLMRRYVEETLTPTLQEKFETAAQNSGTGIALRLSVLSEEPVVWQQRLVLEALRRALPDAPHSRKVAGEVAALVNAQVGRRVDLGGGQVWRERDVLRFVSDSDAVAPVEPARLASGESMDLPGGCLSRSDAPGAPDDIARDDPNTALLDADRVSGALTVRPWQDGDRFRPLGLDGTKLVSDLLTEAQVPPHRKRAASVVTDADGIVWVVGHRMAHRVRLRPDTRDVIRLTFRARENPAHPY
jgi:tRNA(Ile)-lysidine synthase